MNQTHRHNLYLVEYISANCEHFKASGMRLTPCLDVPSFFSPSRGSRSAESLCRNWIACFSLLCCLRAAASKIPESPRSSVRIPVNMSVSGICERYIKKNVTFLESVPARSYVYYEESPCDALVGKRRHPLIIIIIIGP